MLASLPWGLHLISLLALNQALSLYPQALTLSSECSPRASGHQGEQSISNFWNEYIHAYYLHMNPFVVIIF